MAPIWLSQLTVSAQPGSEQVVELLTDSPPQRPALFPSPHPRPGPAQHPSRSPKHCHQCSGTQGRHPLQEAFRGYTASQPHCVVTVFAFPLRLSSQRAAFASSHSPAFFGPPTFAELMTQLVATSHRFYLSTIFCICFHCATLPSPYSRMKVGHCNSFLIPTDPSYSTVLLTCALQSGGHHAISLPTAKTTNPSVGSVLSLRILLNTALQEGSANQLVLATTAARFPSNVIVARGLFHSRPLGLRDYHPSRHWHHLVAFQGFSTFHSIPIYPHISNWTMRVFLFFF